MSRCKVFHIVTFFLVLNFMSITAVAGQLQLTIDNSKIALPLSDFPVLIHLGTSSGQNAVDTSTVFSALGSDSNRKKISVTTDSGGTQQLYVEIEKWDTTSKQAWLWVKVPSVSSSTNTTLYLNYDPGMPANNNYVGDTGSLPATNVWSNVMSQSITSKSRELEWLENIKILLARDTMVKAEVGQLHIILEESFL